MYDKRLELDDVLLPECIQPDLQADRKPDVLVELLDLLVRAGKVVDREKTLQDLARRESECSTGLGRGVAVPHAEGTGVREPGLAIGISREGVDFDALDGDPVQLVFLMVFPPGGRANRQRLVAQVIGLMRRSEVRKALAQAESAGELRQRLLDFLRSAGPGYAGARA